MARTSQLQTRFHRIVTAGVLAVAALWASGFADPPRAFIIGAFSHVAPGTLPAGWATMPLGNTPRSTYATVEKNGITVVQAHADDSASGLVRRITIDPHDFPVLEWRWRAEGVLESGDVRKRRGDDYPARIYITFDYDPSNLSTSEWLKYRAAQALTAHDIPLRALSYIWSNEQRDDVPVPNPFTNWVMMVPVEGGQENVGRWVVERRNIVEDYRRAFGEDPPAITGIALMTDADNTGESVTAYYGDLVLRSE
ncbi:MAG: DUF3047 domain-containing protein [Bacteroidota bacterium]